jgi:hypothetical protein
VPRRSWKRVSRVHRERQERLALRAVERPGVTEMRRRAEVLAKQSHAAANPLTHRASYRQP